MPTELPPMAPHVRPPWGYPEPYVKKLPKIVRVGVILLLATMSAIIGGLMVWLGYKGFMFLAALVGSAQG